jgi:hypothetical protein
MPLIAASLSIARTTNSSMRVNATADMGLWEESPLRALFLQVSAKSAVSMVVSETLTSTTVKTMIFIGKATPNQGQWFANEPATIGAHGLARDAKPISSSRLLGAGRRVMFWSAALLLSVGVPALTMAQNGKINSVKTRAEKGDPQAQFQLGRMHEFGIGVVTNPAKAVKWYRKAAEQGLAQAQHNLGRMYYAGDGVAQNSKQAVKWLLKAAAQNYDLAKNRLGVMYERGEGVTQDYAEAYEWYTRAADAKNMAAIVNRENLTRRMSSQQLAEAQTRLAAELTRTEDEL